MKRHGLRESYPRAQKTDFSAYMLLPTPTWPCLSAHCPSAVQGLWPEYLDSSWLWASGKLGACDFETQPFSVLFVQKKSFILGLSSGCWGLGETWGDLAMGQLMKLNWAIWRGPGPTPLRLILSSILLPFWNEFVLLAGPVAWSLVSFCDSTATLRVTQVSRPIKDFKDRRQRWERRLRCF